MYGGGGGFERGNLDHSGEIELDYEEDDGSQEISQEDAWAVISAFFEEKGLVRQQLDSFNEFIQNTMQEIVDESANIEIRPEAQHYPGRSSDFVEVTCLFLFPVLDHLRIRKLKFVLNIIL